MRPAIIALGLLTAAAAQGQSLVSGRVSIRDEEGTFPAHGAFVQARAGTPEVVVDQARTDRAGRYELAAVPEGRVTLGVIHPGHYVAGAGESESPTAVLTCPASGVCGQTHFLLRPSGAIEGLVSDPYGDPAEGAQVVVLEALENGNPASNPPKFRAEADDRGSFRFHDVIPGAYQVRANDAAGGLFSSEPVEVTVEPGRSAGPIGISLIFGSPRVHTLSGILEGVNFEDDGTARTLELVRIGSDISDFSVRHSILQGPTFSARVEGGEYAVRMRIHSASRPGMVALGRVTVDRDLSGLILRPVLTGALHAVIDFEGMPPRRVGLVLWPLDDRGVPETVQAGPEPAFREKDMVAGRYEIRYRNKDLFVKTPREFEISAGSAEQIAIVFSNRFASLKGRVRDAGNDGAQTVGPFLVALRDRRGVQTVRADPQGRFAFDRLEPGEMRLCAWDDLSVEANDDAVWEKAGQAARVFTVESGDEVQVGLTAAE